MPQLLDDRHPAVTIVVPALNEESRIADCLRALAAQTYPKNRYEVVVVDNGSTDRTCEIVRASGARLLHQAQRSAYRARNLAIESSQGEFVAFTDADCIPEPVWLENLLRCALDSDAWIVGGLTRYDMLHDTLGNRLLIQTHQPHVLRQAIADHHCVAGGNMLVRRRAFETYGLFRVLQSGSDDEFSTRLARAGFPSVFAESAVVHHQCDLTNREYLKRTFRIRFGQVTHARGPRGFIPMLRHLRHLPWKPGLRAGRDAPKMAEHWPPVPFVYDWSYRWAARWASFAGELYALSGLHRDHEPGTASSRASQA